MTSSDAARRDDSLRMLEQEIGIMLRRIRRVMSERAQLVHPDLNATAYLLLGALMESGPMRASVLAETFDLDKGAVSRTVHQLLELGLIERRPDPQDGRASIVQISRPGTRKMNAVAVQRRRYFSKKLSDWEPGDLEDLIASLAKYNAALSD